VSRSDVTDAPHPSHAPADPARDDAPPPRPGAWRHEPATAYALRIVALAVFLAAWEIASRTGAIEPLFASSPSLIAQKLAEMVADGSIWPHIAATVEPFVAALYASPQVAFLPLLIIWLGIGLTSKVALVFVSSFIIMLINTETGVAQVDPRLIETARSFTANERQILRMIVLPAALPLIIAGMRLAIGRALVMVVVAEIYASNQGLGYLIFQAGGMYDTAQVFVGVGILAAAGVTLNALLRALERHLAPWRGGAAA
jgi:ABC-type nitrate/sulfonate/bicarbonate transport system permease component